MAFQIRISPDALRKASGEIKILADASEGLDEQLKVLCSQLEEAWSSNACEQIIEVLNDLIKLIRSGEEKLDESAEMLNSVAQGFESIDNGEISSIAFRLHPIQQDMVSQILSLPEIKLSDGYIRVIPEQVREVGEQCKTLSGEMENNAERMEQIANNLQNDWEGKAYNRFFGEFIGIKQLYLDVAKILTETSSKIVFAATRYEEIDNMLGQ